MSIHIIAAEIARRRKELGADSAENVEQVVLGLLQSEEESNKSPVPGFTYEVAAETRLERIRQLLVEKDFILKEIDSAIEFLTREEHHSAKSVLLELTRRFPAR